MKRNKSPQQTADLFAAEKAEAVVPEANGMDTSAPQPETQPLTLRQTYRLRIERQERRIKLVRRTVRFGKFTGKSVRRLIALITRLSALVDRGTALIPKVKALTGFDVLALLSK